MNYYLIINNKGLQPVASKTPIRGREAGRKVSVDGTCSGVVIISLAEYLYNMIKWHMKR